VLEQCFLQGQPAALFRGQTHAELGNVSVPHDRGAFPVSPFPNSLLEATLLFLAGGFGLAAFSVVVSQACKMLMDGLRVLNTLPGLAGFAYVACK